MRSDHFLVPEGPDADPYRVAAQEQLRTFIEDAATDARLDASEHHRRYQQLRESAITQVRQQEQIVKLGGDPEPLPESVLKLAATASGNESVEKLLSQIRSDRRAAFEQASSPVRGQHDGSRVQEADPQWGSFEAAQTLSRFSQISRHQQLANAGYAPVTGYLEDGRLSEPRPFDAHQNDGRERAYRLAEVVAEKGIRSTAAEMRRQIARRWSR